MGEDKKDKKWEHVRHIPVALLAADAFEGTEEYGDRNDNKKAWAIKFDNIPYEKIKVQSGN